MMESVMVGRASGWWKAWWLGGNRTCRNVLLGEVRYAHIVRHARYALIVRHVLVEIVVARHWNKKMDKHF
jgi:hypothetical protein